jgi:serine/threonine protein kinase
MIKEDETLIGTDINGYIITKFISNGSFGEVYEAKKDGNKFALKIPIKNKEKNGELLLVEEAKVYYHLNKNKTSNIGISTGKLITNKKLDKKIMVMDLLGPSLESILKTKKDLYTNKKTDRKGLRLKSIILLTIQMLTVIQYIHESGYIHRDIKPDNFVMDKVNGNTLYCIDFGLAKKYIKANKHYNFSDDKGFCGTARYASIASHLGHTQSRKDDLEAICYILIYLYKSTLPWANIKHKDKKTKYNLILEQKQKITEEELCKGMGDAESIRVYTALLKYTKSLDFDETPDYHSFIKIFQQLFEKKQYHNSNLELNK